MIFRNEQFVETPEPDEAAVARALRAAGVPWHTIGGNLAAAVAMLLRDLRERCASAGARVIRPGMVVCPADAHGDIHDEVRAVPLVATPAGEADQ